MKTCRFFHWVGSTLAVLLVLASCTPAGTGVDAPEPDGEPAIALVGGTLIDGTGGAPVPASVVLIRGERIESVGTLDSLEVPEGYEEVSTEGMTVMPGLWDPHVHWLYNGHPDTPYWFDTYGGRFESVTIPASAEQMLEAGVTSARDLGAPIEAILSVRERIASGEIPGPTLYAAGPLMFPGEEPGRVHTLEVSGVEDARAKTQGLIDAGVDIIKVFNGQQMPAEDFQVIVETAHAAGLRVTAHGRSDEEIRAGLAAGVDEFQHIGAGSPQYPVDLVGMIRTRVAAGPPLYWSPTIGPQLNADELAASHEFLLDDVNFAGLPDDVATDVRESIANAPFPAPENQAETEAIVARKIAQLRELGVILVAGSDMGVFGVPAAHSIWRDLDAWVRELGMEPMDAIVWATRDAAEALGQGEENGTVEPGKYADIIAVEGNPLEDGMEALRLPDLVIKHGGRY
jgi:imidazolonepropionase-like amidohydrolase